jgi:hypothetical protein
LLAQQLVLYVSFLHRSFFLQFALLIRRSALFKIVSKISFGDNRREEETLHGSVQKYPVQYSNSRTTVVSYVLRLRNYPLVFDEGKISHRYRFAVSYENNFRKGFFLLLSHRTCKISPGKRHSCVYLTVFLIKMYIISQWTRNVEFSAREEVDTHTVIIFSWDISHGFYNNAII